MGRWRQGLVVLLVQMMMLLVLFSSSTSRMVLCTVTSFGALSQTDQFLNERESAVRILAQNVLNLALDTSDCGLSNCVDRCSSRHSCSPLTTDIFTCAAAPASTKDCERNLNRSCLNVNVDFAAKTGFVRVPPGQILSNLSSEITRAICSLANLQFSASSQTSFTQLTFWNYFGSAEGVWRSYPGRAADPHAGCIQYDPRKRPWYILATSVVKDLVVLLDTGQTDAAFNSSKKIITELFGTIIVSDRVNVVTFNATDATLLQQTSFHVSSSSDQALLNTNFNVSALTNNPNGYSNISQGFQTALTTFNSSSKLKMIVVLTDGQFAQSNAFNDSALQVAVSSLNQKGVVVFFFSLGSGDADNPPDPLTALRTLSCQMNSTVSYVSLSNAMTNALWTIRPYFDYQATLRYKQNTTYWTDTYPDYDGLGNVSTVTYPVLSDGILYGVAGIDVVVNSSEIRTGIKTRYVDANVAGDTLACQMHQVNLSQCTNPVTSNLQPLCPQNAYIGMDPEEVYQINLCCGNCSFQVKKKRLAAILGGAAGGLVALISLWIGVMLFLRYRTRQSALKEIREEFARESIATYLYKYRELKAATHGFNMKNKLGEGGFGDVYLGKCKDGSQVAVKRLSAHSTQGKDQFLAEVMTISRVQHRNLVKLRGCCVDGRNRLLVYEYLEKKSLRQTLFGDPDPAEAIHIDWPTRFNIATGTARGLAYLHNELEPRIIHRDIKASNVLLDNNLDAKISDFGLAKLFPEQQTHFTTDVVGTVGYMAPEYLTRCQLTEKVDVFSYGVLLMEVITGKNTMGRTQSGRYVFLVDEVRDLYKEALETSDDQILLQFVDPRLNGEVNGEEAIRLFKIALLCTAESPNSRPSMSQVVPMLLGQQEFPEYFLENLMLPQTPTPRKMGSIPSDLEGLSSSSWPKSPMTPGSTDTMPVPHNSTTDLGDITCLFEGR